MNTYSLFGDTLKGSRMPAAITRRERHRLMRKADILRAAEHVFALKGYYKATIQDIAKEAQYATGTVYLYFKDKDALYISIVEEKLNDLLLLVKDKAAKAESARKKMEVVIYENLSFFEKNRDFYRIFTSEENRWLVKNKFSKLQIMLKYKEYCVELVKDAQAENFIRRDLQAERISDVLGSIMTSVIFDLVQTNSQQRVDLKSTMEVVLDMFFNGAVKKRS
jgi:AcrR family transcriptional regulator